MLHMSTTCPEITTTTADFPTNETRVERSPALPSLPEDLNAQDFPVHRKCVKTRDQCETAMRQLKNLLTGEPCGPGSPRGPWSPGKPGCPWKIKEVSSIQTQGTNKQDSQELQDVIVNTTRIVTGSPLFPCGPMPPGSAVSGTWDSPCETLNIFIDFCFHATTTMFDWCRFKCPLAVNQTI